MTYGSERVRCLPAQDKRVETGAVRFGEDWPGVFLRGDSAGYYAFVLGGVLRVMSDPEAAPGAAWALLGLQRLLAGAVVGSAAELVEIDARAVSRTKATKASLNVADQSMIDVLRAHALPITGDRDEVPSGGPQGLRLRFSEGFGIEAAACKPAESPVACAFRWLRNRGRAHLLSDNEGAFVLVVDSSDEEPGNE